MFTSDEKFKCSTEKGQEGSSIHTDQLDAATNYVFPLVNYMIQVFVLLEIL